MYVIGIFTYKYLDGKYIINNDYNDTVKEFENQNGFNNFLIDDVDERELTKFIGYGTHYNGTIDFKDVYYYKSKNKEIYHIDMESAYANFYKCSWYN